MEERLSVDDFILIGLMGTSATHEHYEPIQKIFYTIIRDTGRLKPTTDFRKNIQLAIEVFYEIQDNPEYENIPYEWMSIIAIGMIKNK